MRSRILYTLKEKSVCVYCLKTLLRDYGPNAQVEYNKRYDALTQEEFDLLKNWLEEEEYEE